MTKSHFCLNNNAIKSITSMERMRIKIVNYYYNNIFSCVAL